MEYITENKYKIFFNLGIYVSVTYISTTISHVQTIE